MDALLRMIDEHHETISSVRFEFTEWISQIYKTHKEDKVHNHIFFTNSIHVTDLAIFFAGMLEEISAYTAEQNDWTETWWKLRTHLTDGISLDYLRWWMPF